MLRFKEYYLREANTIHYEKGETIPEKKFLVKKTFKGNFYVVIQRSKNDKSQDDYGLYIVNKSGKVVQSLGSHTNSSVKTAKDKWITDYVKTAKEAGM